MEATKTSRALFGEACVDDFEFHEEAVVTAQREPVRVKPKGATSVKHEKSRPRTRDRSPTPEIERTRRRNIALRQQLFRDLGLETDVQQCAAQSKPSSSQSGKNKKGKSGKRRTKFARPVAKKRKIKDKSQDDDDSASSHSNSEYASEEEMDDSSPYNSEDDDPTYKVGH